MIFLSLSVLMIIGVIVVDDGVEGVDGVGGDVSGDGDCDGVEFSVVEDDRLLEVDPPPPVRFVVAALIAVDVCSFPKSSMAQILK